MRLNHLAYFVMALAVLPIANACADHPANVAAVRLAGKPQDIGKLWAELNRDTIVADVTKHFLKPAADRGITEQMLIDRSQKFLTIAREIAPHWIDEATAIARTAGLDERLYLSFIANVYRNLFLHGECTSYTISSRSTRDNAIFFHKTRDNVDKPQAAYLLESSLAGINRFIAVSDVSVISCMMMVNEKGLAGSADTGGLPVREPRFEGMMNTFILRHIAERAETCADALAIVERFVRNRWYAGGAKTGTHWLFVDRNGTILEVSNNSDEMSHRYHTEGVYFSMRDKSAAATTLRQAPCPVDFHTFRNVSRDPSICIKSSISGMTVEIDRRHPEMLTCAWVSLPARSLGFPLFMGGRQTPTCLVDGGVYTAANRLTCSPRVFEGIEKHAYFNKQQLAGQIGNLLRDSHTDQARELLDAWSHNYAEAFLDLLRNLP